MRRLWFGGIACVLALCAGIAHAEERVRVALLPMLVRSAEGREYLQQGLLGPASHELYAVRDGLEDSVRTDGKSA